MTTEFLASIRRNQKQWMAVLTILAIFAFLFDDLMRGTTGNQVLNGTIIMAMLVGGAFAILGYPRQKTLEYACAGAVLGGLVGFVGLRARGPQALVTSVAGSLTQDDLNGLRNKRARTQGFLTAVAKQLGENAQAANLGGQDDDSLIDFVVMKHEAKKQGISLANEAVNKFLSEVTQDKLSGKQFQAALQEARMSESDVFDNLREILEVGLLQNLMSPPANRQMISQQLRIATSTPAQRWDAYQKLNVKQGLSTVAVPVKDFVSKVPEPTDEEVRAYFDKHKQGFEVESTGTVGFKVPPKVQLAYLSISGLEKFEKQVRRPTDKEITDFYNRNKFRYVIPDLPDAGTTIDMPELKSNVDGASGEAPADATKVENSGEPTPSTDKPEEKPSEEKPSGEKASDDKPDAKKTEEPKQPDAGNKEDVKKESTKDTDGCADDAQNAKQAAEKVPAADVKAEGEKKAGEEKPTSDKDAEPKPAAQEKSGGDEKTVSEKDVAEKEPADKKEKSEKQTPPTDEKSDPFSDIVIPKAPPKEPKYRELDDDLKQKIEEEILKSRAIAKMSNIADEALREMTNLSASYYEAKPKDRPNVAKTFPEKLKAYAEKHGMVYAESEPLTQLELARGTKEPLGTGYDPLIAMRNPQSIMIVAHEAFATDADSGKPRLTLYSPRRANSVSTKVSVPLHSSPLADSLYSYWKIAEIPAQEPDLKDEGVRAKVVAAWKFEKARGLALKRAEALADLMQKSKDNVAATLASQTVNGDSDSDAITIHEPRRFSWLRLPRSLPSQAMGLEQNRPEMSFVNGIDGVGMEFMRKVFSELGEGDSGVSSNISKSIFYAVMVHDRDSVKGDEADTADSQQAKFMKEQFSGFLPTPYEFLGAVTQQSVDGSFQLGLRKRFDLNQVTQPTREEQ